MIIDEVRAELFKVLEKEGNGDQTAYQFEEL